MLRFKTRDFGDGEKMLIGPVQNNGEFDWYPVIHIECLEEHEDFNEKWLFQVKAVSPEAAGQTKVDAAVGCCGYEEDDSIENQVYSLAEYGTFAMIHEELGNNLRTLIKKAKEEANLCCRLTGFYFDRPQNMIGATGWDRIKGNLWPSYSMVHDRALMMYITRCVIYVTASLILTMLR